MSLIKLRSNNNGSIMNGMRRDRFLEEEEGDLVDVVDRDLEVVEEEGREEGEGDGVVGGERLEEVGKGEDGGDERRNE